MDDSDSFSDVFNAPGVAAPLAAHDLKAMRSLLDQINGSAEKVSRTLLNGFGAAAASGKSFNETLSTIGMSLARLALREGTKALTQGLVNSLGGMFSQAFNSQSVTPFAQGGVIASPAYFNNGTTVGLMGERGAEAVMPLARGADGRLGVVAGGSGARPVAVTVNIAAQDIDSFRRSEAQISSALARAVARGQRNL
ncbi:MAG: phage tail protein [Methylocystis sp.]|nr:MAG: phage tail protein [Methylocystis sp.]